MLRVILCPVLALSLVACSLVGKERLSDSTTLMIEQIEGSYNRSTNLTEKAIYLKDLLKYHSRMDQVDDVIKVHISLATVFYKLDMSKESNYHLSEAVSIQKSTGSKAHLYYLYLAKGRLDNDKSALKKALEHAQNYLDKAIVLAYLEEAKQALALIENKKASIRQVDTFAYIYFSYAKSEKAPGVAQEALTLYKQSENATGIARTLLLLSDLYRKDSQSLAEEYLSRANIVTRSLADGKSKRSLEDEIDKRWK